MQKNIYIAYSSVDKELFVRFKKHLSIFEYNNYISLLPENIIIADKEYKLSQLKSQADILFLLVSIDFITSALFKDDDFQLLLRKSGNIKIIPVLIQHCNWESTVLSNFLVKPDIKIPVSDKYWDSVEHAFSEIMKELKILFADQENINFVQNNLKNEKQYPAVSKENSEYKMFKKSIKKANNFFEEKNWADAIKSYRNAIKYYQEGYYPDINTIRQQIHFCSEELLYNRNIETAERAMKEKSYKSAVKYFKEALNYKKSSEIEQKYLKAEKLFHKSEKKKSSKTKIQNTEQAKSDLYRNKLLMILLFLLSVVTSVLLTVLYFNIYVLPNKKLFKTEIVDKNIQIKNRSSNDKKLKVRENNIRTQKTQNYFDKIILTADNYVNNRKFKNALNMLIRADRKKLNDQQKLFLDYKTDSIYILAINDFEKRTAAYLRKNQYKPEYHQSFFKEIKYFLSIKNKAVNKKNKLYRIAYRLNDVYVRHYINYTNRLVKKHEYPKAKENLLYLRQAIIYPTKEQKILIARKLDNIQKIEKLINQYSD